jgi:hypothetical protein
MEIVKIVLFWTRQDFRQFNYKVENRNSPVLFAAVRADFLQVPSIVGLIQLNNRERSLFPENKRQGLNYLFVNRFFALKHNQNINTSKFFDDNN